VTVRRTFVHVAMLFASTTWTVAWLAVARSRYGAERVCELMAGPWLPCGPHDWVTPLTLALAGVVGAAVAVRVSARGIDRLRDTRSLRRA
jgi:hypothetical protein